MKHFPLLIAILTFVACSKEETYGPHKLKNGQQVELQVDHRYGATEDLLLLMPQNVPARMSLYGFTDREPGYIYNVKAKMVVPETPLADAPSYHLEFMEVLRRNKYEGNESFKIQLIQSQVPGSPTIMVNKQNGFYYFMYEKLRLSYANEEIKSQLEEIWQNAEDIRVNWQTNQQQSSPKWKSIEATVRHDPDNFGKAYLVEQIMFIE